MQLIPGGACSAIHLSPAALRRASTQLPEPRGQVPHRQIRGGSAILGPDSVRGIHAGLGGQGVVLGRGKCAQLPVKRRKSRHEQNGNAFFAAARVA